MDEKLVNRIKEENPDLYINYSNLPIILKEILLIRVRTLMTTYEINLKSTHFFLRKNLPSENFFRVFEDRAESYDPKALNIDLNSSEANKIQFAKTLGGLISRKLLKIIITCPVTRGKLEFTLNEYFISDCKTNSKVFEIVKEKLGLLEFQDLINLEIQ